MKIIRLAGLGLAAALVLANPTFPAENRAVFDFETDGCGFTSIYADYPGGQEEFSN